MAQKEKISTEIFSLSLLRIHDPLILRLPFGTKNYRIWGFPYLSVGIRAFRAASTQGAKAFIAVIHGFFLLWDFILLHSSPFISKRNAKKEH